MDSFISWIGGKRLLRKKILAQFPPDGSYDRYIEVFGGAGWVLFSKDRHAKMEIYNDVDGNLVNLFRVVKFHPEALQKELDWVLTSREQFIDALQDIKGLTDIQRAARFWAVIKESFGTDLRSFCVKGRDIQRAVDFLREASVRLNKVVIENGDFNRIISTYDRPSTLFYFDPPYYEAERYYHGTFLPEDHKRLKESLQGIKGKFLLSYNDCQEIRELYNGYKITELDRRNSLTIKSCEKNYHELVIKNY